MAQLVGHIAFDLKLFGSIPAVFWETVVGFNCHTPHRPAWSCLVCKEKWVAPLQGVLNCLFAQKSCYVDNEIVIGIRDFFRDAKFLVVYTTSSSLLDVCIYVYIGQWNDLLHNPIEIWNTKISTYMKLSTKSYLEVFSCILRCCALSEITIAQVFSLICTLDRNNYLVKVIKLVIADLTMSRFCSYLENWANDDENKF